MEPRALTVPNKSLTIQAGDVGRQEHTPSVSPANPVRKHMAVRPAANGLENKISAPASPVAIVILSHVRPARRPKIRYMS